MPEKPESSDRPVESTQPQIAVDLEGARAPVPTSKAVDDLPKLQLVVGQAAAEADSFTDFLEGKLTEPEKPKFKDNYKTTEAQQAVNDAIKDNGYVVSHIGAEWCGPCKKMEREVWPTIEKEFKGKAAFLHMDGDQFDKLSKEGKMPKDFGPVGSAESYPTVRILKPERLPNGGTKFVQVAELTNFQSVESMRETLQKKLQPPSVKR